MSQSTDPVQALEQIRAAAERLAPHIRTTPTVYSYTFSETLGTDVFLKLENLQRTGSFKVRGALNRILTLPEEARAKGLIAASAGNHAQGVALAASLAGCSSKIVMPVNTALMKVERTMGYGAEVVLHGANYDEAAAHAREIADAEGRTPVHPFDDWEVIYGQGTVGLEIAEQIPDVGSVILPIGGGGLIAGVALALKALRPEVAIIGVQAEGASPMVQSIQEGEKRVVESPRTLAEGIRVGKVGDLTYQVVRDLVDRTVTVNEDEIESGVVELMEKNKVVAEAAAVTPIAAMLAGKVRSRETVCAVISGGNIDLSTIGRLIESGLSRRGRLTSIRLRMVDEPGSLRCMLEAMEAAHANIRDVRHDRAGWKVPIGSVEVEVLIETRSADAGANIARQLAQMGYEVIDPIIAP
ncbi:MAG: threonine ammonia-lyase [Planctomycetota bacterium]|nr:threonine ammonia-lyase [Planctomycetota bacterium]